MIFISQIIILIAVLAILSVGIIKISNNVFNHILINYFTKVIINSAQNLQSIYAAQGNYKGLDNPPSPVVLLSYDLLDSAWTTQDFNHGPNSGKPYLIYKNIYKLFSYPLPVNGIPNKSFALTLDRLNKEICIGLLSKLSNYGSALLVAQIQVHPSNPKWLTGPKTRDIANKDITTLSSSSPGPGGWHVVRGYGENFNVSRSIEVCSLSTKFFKLTFVV